MCRVPCAVCRVLYVLCCVLSLTFAFFLSFLVSEMAGRRERSKGLFRGVLL